MQKTIGMSPCCSICDIVDIFSLISYAYLMVFNGISEITQGNICCWIYSSLIMKALTMSERLFSLIVIMFVPQGLKSEGLYRISGFSDLLEEVKMSFDKGMRSFTDF